VRVESAARAAAAGAAAAGRSAGQAHPGAATVTVRGLSASYGEWPATAPILADIDFSLTPGSRLAVVGKSGCGKSTLLHVLAGLLAPTAGEVRVDDLVVAGSDGDGSSRSSCRSGHAAYMFQQDLLLPWKTVLGNAVFTAEVARRKRPGGVRSAPDLRAQAGVILREFGLGSALNSLPAQLSGGMRQRVALARTLVLGRGLVLLDEPFGSLDALTRAEMQRWLLEVMAAHPATWVLVTHDVREAVLLGDRVAVLAGRPASTAGWTDVPLSAAERQGLAALESGAAGEAFAAAEPPAGVGGGVVDLDLAAATMRRLTAQVRDQLAERKTA
jgi:ABC-type nitrate/sulfonate/bicarbonate transport system ATPase subunit